MTKTFASRLGSDMDPRSAAGKAATTVQMLRAGPASMCDAPTPSLAQLQHQERADNSSRTAQLMASADMMAGDKGGAPAQRVEDEELLQGKFAPVQRLEDEELLQAKCDPVQRMEEEKPLQGRFPAQRAAHLEAAPNKTGMPNQLKAGIESLSDNRPEVVAQRKLAEMMNNSPHVLQQLALSDAIHNSPRMVAQRHQMNALFGGTVKPQGDGAMPAEASPAQREEKTNKTGLPNQLKSGIESLSGMSMDHVKVHYNSDKPAQLQARAYAQGSVIHLGAGQERHLPHEAWHVVQQAQGRVRPTLQMKAGAVNDDPSLEKEADMMGEKAAQFKSDHVARDLVAEERVAGAVTQRVAGFLPVALSRSVDNSAPSTLQFVDLTEENYDQVKTYMAGILQRYPVTQYYYLSLGKSPTPLIAFLQAAGREANLADIGSNLPLSKFSHRAKSSTNSNLGNELTSSQLTELHHHFDQFVPSAEQLGNRQLLLIDFVQSGRSLIAATDHLREYLAKVYETDLFKLWTGIYGYGLAGTIADEKPEVQPFALTELDTAHAAAPYLDAAAIPHENLPGSMGENGSLGALVGAEKFKPDAEYPEDFIVKNGARSDDLIASPKYEQLISAFQEFMRRDNGFEALRLLSGG